MNKFALGAVFASLSSSVFAADAIAIADSGFAAPKVSGYFEGYLGGLSIQDFGEDTLWTFGGAGRINVPVNERWNLQGDVFADRVRFDDMVNMTNFGAAAHAYWRDPSSYALGAFASYSRTNIIGAEFPNYTVGAEGQVYLDNVTLYGQAYYGQTEFLDVADLDVLGARAVARYFVQPNLRIDGEFGFERLDFDGDKLDTYSLAAQAMYRFEGSPVSAFGRYQFNTADFGGMDLKSHKFTLGLRASFGTGTLIDEDRFGATMDTYRPNIAFPLVGFGAP